MLNGSNNADITSVSSGGATGPPADPDARPGHAVWIRGGDLLVQDCTISCAIGNAVVIGARGAPFRGQGSTQALCEAHGRLPRLVNCRIESPVVSQPAEVGGHEGVAAGVCVEVMAAEIVSCSFHGNFNQIELGYSKPGTLIHGCHLDGAQENGVYSYDEAQARIICTAIRGGRECVRCCEGSRLVLEECSLEGFSSSGVSAQDQVRQDRKYSPPRSLPHKKLIRHRGAGQCG